MFRKLIFKTAFASAKAGVKSDADIITDSLAQAKARVCTLSGSFRDGLMKNGFYSESDFYQKWTSEVTEQYIRKYPPKYPSQQKFLSEEIIPYINELSPASISRLLIGYSCSEFVNVCNNLTAQGDTSGKSALKELEAIVKYSFHSRGLGDALEDMIL
jgi:hypothetical protein